MQNYKVKFIERNDLKMRKNLFSVLLTLEGCIQQGYKIGDAVLDDDGNGDPKDTAVKRPVADVTV